MFSPNVSVHQAGTVNKWGKWGRWLYYSCRLWSEYLLVRGWELKVGLFISTALLILGTLVNLHSMAVRNVAYFGGTAQKFSPELANRFSGFYFSRENPRFNSLYCFFTLSTKDDPVPEASRGWLVEDRSAKYQAILLVQCPLDPQRLALETLHQLVLTKPTNY